jgi:hypothetical protein
MGQLVLKRASASRPSGEWNDDDFDVLADGIVVGRIFKANATPVGMSWMWTLAFGQHEDRSPTLGYAETREAAMAAFARAGGGSETQGNEHHDWRVARTCRLNFCMAGRWSPKNWK